MPGVASDAATESVSVSGNGSGVGMFGMSTDELDQRMRDQQGGFGGNGGLGGLGAPGAGLPGGGGAAGGGGPGGGGPVAVEGAEEGLADSEAVAVEAEPWSSGVGADLTSIVPTVRSTIRPPIPRLMPRPTPSPTARKIRPHT